MGINEKIGLHIKSLRDARNMKQSEFADLLNISQSAVQRMEKGETSSWADNLPNICGVFHIKPDEFLAPITGNWIQNNYDNANQNTNVSLFPDKLIEQYEIRINEKDEYIMYLKNENTALKNENKTQ